MLARTQLVRIQLAMYARLRGYARQFVAELPAPLKKYSLEYQRDFQRSKTISSKRELLSEIEKSDLIFCGDYHTLPQAQRTLLQLLRETAQRIKSLNKEMILALEMVGPEHQSIIQNYLAGHISEKELLAGIQFESEWGFSWESYRPLFQFAKQNGITVVGLKGVKGAVSANDSLSSRDKFAARQIASHFESRRNATIFAFMGDLHLASQHLPREVEIAMNRRDIKKRSLIIHQNHDASFWELARRGVEADVIRLGENIFCVMNTSPWVKLQSEVSWAEKLIEGDCEISLDDEIEELTSALAFFFKFPYRSLGDFSVLQKEDFALVEATLREASSFAEDWVCLARESKSLFIPSKKILFLRKPSFNQLAAQSSQYLHAALSGANLLNRSPRSHFYAHLWIEAVGYLGSKILNPKRRTDGPQDLIGRRPEIKWVVEKLAEETDWSLSSRKTAPRERRLARNCHSVYLRGSRTLGRILGEAIYTAMTDDFISLQEVRSLFTNPFRNPAAARHLYYQWIAKIDPAGYRSFRKSDAL